MNKELVFCISFIKSLQGEGISVQVTIVMSFTESDG